MDCRGVLVSLKERGIEYSHESDQIRSIDRDERDHARSIGHSHERDQIRLIDSDGRDQI